jgi:hypothetical protein
VAAISILVIIGLAVWFYRTAERLSLPGLAWAIAGVLVYYGGFVFWMYAVLRSVMGGLFHTHGFWVAIGMDASSILFGALCAVLFRFKVLMKKGQKPFEASF